MVKPTRQIPDSLDVATFSPNPIGCLSIQVQAMGLVEKHAALGLASE